jgi:hydroxymethylpyrimidine pyrophosphatase-like HAD family hydrolase
MDNQINYNKRFRWNFIDLEHQIADYTKTVFQELHKQGYLIIIATSEHHLDTMPIVDTLDFNLFK